MKSDLSCQDWRNAIRPNRTGRLGKLIRLIQYLPPKVSHALM
jgi:hypothetical protein